MLRRASFETERLLPALKKIMSDALGITEDEAVIWPLEVRLDEIPKEGWAVAYRMFGGVARPTVSRRSGLRQLQYQLDVAGSSRDKAFKGADLLYEEFQCFKPQYLGELKIDDTNPPAVAVTLLLTIQE